MPDVNDDNLFIVDVTSVANSFSRLTLGPSSANWQWVIGNVLQPALDATYKCKLITENHDCFKPGRRFRERWDIKAAPWDNFVRLLSGCLHFPFVLLQNPSNAHTQSFEQMRQGYTINWLSEMLSRIGLSLDDVPVLDICALFSDEDLQEMNAEKRSCAVEDAYQLVEEMLRILRPILIISCQCMTQGTWKADGQAAWKPAKNELARRLCSNVTEARAHRAVTIDSGDLRIWVIRGFHPRRLYYKPDLSPVLTKLFCDIYEPCVRWRLRRVTASFEKPTNTEQVHSQTRSPSPSPIPRKTSTRTRTKAEDIKPRRKAATAQSLTLPLAAAPSNTHAATHSALHNATQANREHLPAAKQLAYQPADESKNINEQGMYRFRVATGEMINWANGRLEFEARIYAPRALNPDYHYVPELGGWYDSDEECEERNRADDIMRMIEGDWD